jgi:hypothetical protein
VHRVGSGKAVKEIVRCPVLLDDDDDVPNFGGARLEYPAPGASGGALGLKTAAQPTSVAVRASRLTYGYWVTLAATG